MMDVKNSIIEWYLKNIRIPRREDLSNPGFITERVGLKQTHFLREIAIPEGLLLEIENKISGEGMEKILYRIGKEFGYRYAMSSQLTRISDTNRQKFLRRANFLVRYMESIDYGSNLEEEVDYENRSFHLESDEYIICRNNGKGYLLGTGGIAGIWSYVVEDRGIECSQPECVGRGDKKCIFLAAPRKYLKERGMDFFDASLRKDLKIDSQYKSMNEVRKTKYATSSLQDMIDVDFFKRGGRKIMYSGERYVLVEASLLYLLEEDIKDNLLFKAAYGYGRRLGEKTETENISKFLKEYLSICGWGDPLIKDGDKVIINMFPWTRFYGNTSFPVFRGLVSGILSGMGEDKIEFLKTEEDVSGENLLLEIY